MTNYIATGRITTGRRAYQSPQLKEQGRVHQLTLKIGSVSDGMGSHPL